MRTFQAVALGTTLALFGFIGSLSAQTASTDQEGNPPVFYQQESNPSVFYQTLPSEHGLYIYPPVSVKTAPNSHKVRRLTTSKLAPKAHRDGHLTTATAAPPKPHKARRLAISKLAPKTPKNQPLTTATAAPPKSHKVRRLAISKLVPEAHRDSHLTTATATPKKMGLKTRRVPHRAIATATPNSQDKHVTTPEVTSKAQKAMPNEALLKEQTPTPEETTHKDKAHRLAIQVNQNDPAVMNLALNNAENVIEYYNGRGEDVQVEIVTFGPGLHMLRADTSPVKDRIERLKNHSLQEVTFLACGNTQARMEKSEGKPIPILPQATMVPSGVVRLMELQEQGWSYVRP